LAIYPRIFPELSYQFRQFAYRGNPAGYGYQRSFSTTKVVTPKTSSPLWLRQLEAD
jgi:hypothetical protein